LEDYFGSSLSNRTDESGKDEEGESKPEHAKMVRGIDSTRTTGRWVVKSLVQLGVGALTLGLIVGLAHGRNRNLPPLKLPKTEGYRCFPK
jgi:hypothetical protein